MLKNIIQKPLKLNYFLKRIYLVIFLWLDKLCDTIFKKCASLDFISYQYNEDDNFD